MTNRTLIVLAGALVIFGALALLGQREQQPSVSLDTLLYPGLQEDLDDVTRMELVGAGAEIIATLERGPGGWSVVERSGYPADLQKVRHTLLSLAETRVVEAKTANPEWHERLGVDAIDNEDASGIAVRLTGTEVPVNLIVGDTVGDYQAYVRRAEEAQSYLIDRDPEVGSAVTDWLDTEIMAIPGDRIRRVTVTHPDGEVLTVVKDDPETANFTVEAIPADRELQYDSVANVMGNVLASLSLQDVETATASEEPATVTDFRTFDGLVITAESFERDDDAWVSFRVDYEPPGDAAAAAAEPASEEEETAPAEAGPDVEAEARALEERLGGWRFRIPTYQFDQMTRRMSDLLRAPPESNGTS